MNEFMSVYGKILEISLREKRTNANSHHSCFTFTCTIAW